MFGTGFAASSSPFGGTSTFGQTPSQSPFGAAPSSNVFGQQSQPAFGASPAPAFGASTPAFGAASTPAFGASSAPAFGGGAFGAKPAGFGFGAPASSPAFGAAPASPFGAASAPAFGAASSAPAFGGASPSPFGASAPAFGATSSPAFGAASTPAFGQTLAAFGSTAFGASPGGTGFGAGAGSAFGGAAARGTRSTAFRKTQETDQSATGKTTVNYNSISCMPEYSGKSAEELRWEDYEDGCKGNTGGAFGQQQQPASAASPFGASASAFGATSAPAFGAAASTPAFGAAAPAFGAVPASSPGFGFGGTSAPAFSAASSAPAFGASPSPFGAPASSSPFGATSTPAFGAASAPAFGASPAPAFGATSSSPGFGASTFGAQASSPAFGGFGATSAPAFGATSAPAFGASASSSAFGFGGATAAPAFGASSSAFSFTPPASGFGAPATSSSPFGAPAASSASLFGASSTPAFGGTSTSLFGAQGAKPASTPFAPAAGAGGSLFGGTPSSAPAFGATPSTGFGAPAAGGSLFGGTPASTPLFGATNTAGGSLFGGGTAGGLFGSTTPFSSTPQLTAQAGALVPAQPVQAPTVGGSPYGMLPEAPRASPLPDNKVGLTQQRLAGSLAGGTPRPMALISPRSITPRSGVRMRPRRSLSAATSRLSRSPADFLALAGGAGEGGAAGNGEGGAGNATPSANVFVPRDNPRRLFIRDQLPSTQGAAGTTSSPSLRAGVTPGRDVRTPGTALRLTPVAPASNAGGRATAREFAEYAPGAGGERAQEQGGHLGENGRAEEEGVLDDAELARLLPSLTRQGYYTKPSLQQLATLGREDPSALERVPQFTVGCRGVGSVTFLEPTDVRGLDLDAIVTLTKGSIEVYLEDGDKPEVGKGLNKAAVVTMERIHKIDKHTGKPTTDQEAIDRFNRKLKRVTAEQGAAFVAYEPLAGEWKFQVEHFSRYGLVDSDDEEEAAGAGGESDGELEGFGVRRLAAGAQQAQRAARLEKGKKGDLRQESEGQPSASLAGDLQDMHDVTMTPASNGEREERRGGRGAMSAGRALQVALPAQLGMDPEELQRIRDNLFSSATRQVFPTPTLGHQRVIHVDLQQAQQEGAEEGGLSVSPATAVTRSRPRGSQAGAPSLYGEAARKVPRRSSWHQRAQHALHAPTPLGSASLKAGAGGIGGAGSLPLLPSGPTPVSPVPLQRTAPLCPFPAPRRSSAAAAGAGEERCLPDAGLFQGTSFRAGWAAPATLAFAGGRPSSAAHVAVRQVQPVALTGMSQRDPEVLRARLEALMRLHIQHSMPDTGSGGSEGEDSMQGEEAPPGRCVASGVGASGAGEGEAAAGVAPRWRLRCGRGEDLRQLTLAYIQSASEAAAQAEGVDRTLLRHQATTWELVHVLFGAIEGEQAEEREDDMQAEEREDDMQAESLYRLAAFKRRAGVSRWLRDHARAAVERAQQQGAQSGNGAEVAHRLLSLLSGHQLVGATALAAATGNVRLATLLAQAGSKSVSKGQLAAQLTVWGDAGMEPHISPPMRQLYALLAGDVDAVIPHLQGLDWRRGFGMHLWYGKPPGASVAEALESYSAAVGDGLAPLPLPLYAEQPSSSTRAVPPLGGSLDVAFELLRLFAVVSEMGQSEAGALEAALPQLLAQLLRPGGYSPDPLDYSFSWHLLTLLSAIEVLPSEAAFAQVFAAHMSFIAQLEGAGALAPWAVYVALHLPEAPAGSPWEGQATRDKVVRELLVRHCPEWGGDAEVLEFFESTLRLPRAWLEEAQAQWAQYGQDDAGRLQHLLEAGDWAQSHTLLCTLVAPRWFLGGASGLRQLEDVLCALEPHAAAIDAAHGPGTWAKGGGVYTAFLYLQGLYSELLQRRNSPCGLSFEERMAACQRLAELLQAASAAWGLADGAGGALQQAAYSCMSERLAGWVVGDRTKASQLLPSAAQALLAAALPALRQADVAAGIQLAAVNLAEGIA